MISGSGSSEDRRPIASRMATREPTPRSRRGPSYSPSPVARARRRSRSNDDNRLRKRRSCRSRSRTRSDECEDSQCCDRTPRSDVDESAGWYQDDGQEEFAVRIDGYDRIFNCDYCHAFLSSLVYECDEGDLTCRRCHEEANGEECRKCRSTEYGRSHGVARLLRSIRFACRNYDYGCPAFLPRHAMDAHERACVHEPCFCPVRRCGYSAPVDELQLHLTAQHGWSLVRIRYGEAVQVPVQDPSILRADDGGRLFHLSCAMERDATKMSMVCIRPDNVDAAKEAFTYEVKTATPEDRLRMQAAVWSTSLRHGMREASQVALTVPDDMVPQQGGFVEVCVRKEPPVAVAAS